MANSSMDKSPEFVVPASRVALADAARKAYNNSKICCEGAKS